MARGQDGYRYVRSYRTKDNTERIALWEIVNGKACRVGTAHSDEEYRAFLAGSKPRWGNRA